MAILEVNRKWFKDSGRLAGPDVSYRLGYEIITDKPDHTIFDIAFDGRIPQRGDAFAGDPTALVNSREFSRKKDSRTVWQATIEFKRPDSQQQQQQQQTPNPLDRPVERSTDSTKVRLAVSEDADGTPIVNTAGEAFDPPVEIEVVHKLFTFVRNEPTFRGDWFLYENRVNSTPFGVIDEEGTVRCNKIAEREMFEEGIAYVQATYVFEFAPEGWQSRPMQRGFRQLNDAGDLVRILDDKKQPIQKAWPLDADGKALAKADIPDGIIFGKADGTPFKTHAAADFQQLQLPGI